MTILITQIRLSRDSLPQITPIQQMLNFYFNDNSYYTDSALHAYSHQRLQVSKVINMFYLLNL